MNRLALPFLVVVLLGACAEAPKAPPPVAPAPVAAPAPAPVVAPAPVPVPAPAPVVAREPDPADVNAYKVEAAERIAKVNANVEKKNVKRPADAKIAGLTVVGVQVRADGTTERVWVVRSSSKPKLDQAALDAFGKAVPLPAPGERAMVGRGYVVYAESCIHRTDGKIQLVSKTLP